MGEEIFRDFIHEHPLSQIPNSSQTWCDGCCRYFLPGEAAYGCSRNCRFDLVLHKECLEMPREIRHHAHPSHPLTLQTQYSGNRKCAVCEDEEWYGMMYKCSKGCESWWIHLVCAGGLALADEDKKRHPPINHHPSHPQHPLIFSSKTTSCSFPCDACGTEKGGNSYICFICDYWIHESCALMAASASYPHHHPDHPLTLAYYPPCEYIKYEFECAICRGALRLRHWVYHCELCSYVVHIKCATDTSPAALSNSFDNENEVDDHKDVIECPMNDIYEEIIRPFVKREREGGEIFLPHDDSVHGKYTFNQHHHPLSFTMFSTSSSSSSHDHNDDDDDDEDDDLDIIPRSEVTCDGCTLPIIQTMQTSSSFSNEYDNGYMSCNECKYFLHLACLNLQPELPSLPLHPINDHNLTLRNTGKLTNWEFCSICRLPTNGLLYSCTKCSFQSDIKCASLPTTIKHAAHPHHLLEFVTKEHKYSHLCAVCRYGIFEPKYYRCDRCNFNVCADCVFLPPRNKHRAEKHWISLTYKAYVNRPGDFYCSSCEVKMNPKRCMYHCRDCDQSFHPRCFPATSGSFRNINFVRRQYVIPTIHHPHHPLRFQIITKKKLCDLCHLRSYEWPGLQCASCYFVMCQ